jgi:hypothetical protein
MNGNEVGAKRFANEASGGCSHRKFSKEFEVKLNDLKAVHDNIKKDVKQWLEKQSFECSEEFDLETDLGGFKLRGRADIMCKESVEEPVKSTKEPKEIVELIIEMKSSQIGRGKIADIYQALVYGYMWKKRYGKKPQIILIYRRGLETTTDTKTKVNVGPRTIELPNKYVYIKLNIDLDVEDIAKELGMYGYVLGWECEYCVNEDCPLNKARPAQQ